MERVWHLKYLGVQLNKEHSWTKHIDNLILKAWQQLYFVHHLAGLRFSKQVTWHMVYTCTLKSPLAGNIMVWQWHGAGSQALSSSVVCSAEPATKCPYLPCRASTTVHSEWLCNIHCCITLSDSGLTTSYYPSTLFLKLLVVFFSSWFPLTASSLVSVPLQ